MFSKLLFKIGQNLRNPSLQNLYFFLKEAEKWKLEQLVSYQEKKLFELVNIAYEYSSYYKNSFDLLGLKPSDIKSIEDLKKLPIISKKELLLYNSEIHTTNSFKKLFEANTSGTSGESLKFKRDEHADSFNRASIFRGYSWYTIKPWDRNGYFWGFDFSKSEEKKVKVTDWLQNRFRIFSYNRKDVAIFIRKLRKATYLHGYSSMVYEMAKLINSQNFKKPLKLKMVKGTSEKIVEAYQEEIKKAFGIKMISEYGAAETGIIAFECRNGNMHINMEGVIVEEVDNEIIVTNLQMKSFPIIRYRLGDYIKLAVKDKRCSCGMHHPILEEVTGRIGKLVYGKNNTYPSLYFYYIFKNLAQHKGLELMYQVQQNKKGELLFLIEGNLTKKELNLVQQEIETYFKKDMNYTIEVSKKLVSKNTKLKSFISTI